MMKADLVPDLATEIMWRCITRSFESSVLLIIYSLLRASNMSCELQHMPCPILKERTIRDVTKDPHTQQEFGNNFCSVISMSKAGK